MPSLPVNAQDLGDGVVMLSATGNSNTVRLDDAEVTQLFTEAGVPFPLHEIMFVRVQHNNSGLFVTGRVRRVTGNGLAASQDIFDFVCSPGRTDVYSLNDRAL